MSYQVIARKWRPKNFSSLIGQEHISTTLLNALKSDRLAHALLFTGPRGTGKTSTARILAKSLRCPNAKNFVPCDKCSTCEEISSGSSLDVIEIDGASNNGVDAIRELRDTVHFMPTSGQWKVYIIDEVHMLTTSAFNALLKTLEEPPAHVIFVMATTEVQKIPATILSRCQRFDFRRISLKQVAEHLQTIADAEEIKIEPSALWMIVRQSEGSMRDSQSLLDQIANYSNRKITVDKVVEVLGLTERALLNEALTGLVNRDRGAILKLVEKIIQSGADAKIFAQDLLEQIRNLMVVKLDALSALMDLPDNEIAELKQLGKDLSSEDVHLLFDMCFKGVNDLIRAQDPCLVLEMLLFRMCEAPNIQSLKEILSGKLVSAPASTRSSAPEVKRAPSNASQPQKVPGTFDAGKWNTFVGNLQSLNALFGAKLANTHFISLVGDKLTIGLPKQHEFLHSQLTDAEFLKKVGNYLNTFMGKVFKIEVIVEDQASGLSLHASEEKAKSDEQKKTQDLVESNPLVQSVKKHLNAKVQSIKERR
jgi:DNA polymerase III subunit gamma/tau